ncbi:MAG: outer membrane beta-barrel protein [Deltaproteobacteria bacterium]|nr:outer membrane beta-barrel protein [Deltaproteobacteria bacterium]
MKNRLACIIATGILFFGLTGALAAETGDKAQRHGKISVGARAGYNQFEGGELDGNEVEIDPSGCYGVNASYFVWKDLSVEGALEYGRYRFNLKPPGEKLAQEIGDVEQVGFLCTIRYQPLMFKDVMPYVGVGAGYYAHDFDHFVQGVEVKLADDFGFHVAAGGDYHAQGPVWLTLDMRYTWNDTHEEDPTIKNPQDICLDVFQAFVGMKLYF